MNAPSKSTLSGLVTTIGILVLLLGTSIGNAYAMFIIAIAAIAIIAVIAVVMTVDRRLSIWGVVFGVTLAFVTALAVALGITS